MALTKKDIENMKEGFATKDDLKVFATKDDLIKLSEVFVTKHDFDSKINDFRAEVKDQILTSQDKIMKKIEDMTTEQKIFNAQFKRQEEKVEDHEKRITVLESA